MQERRITRIVEGLWSPPMQNYLASLILYTFFPLTPLLLEWWVTGTRSARSMTLAASMYMLYTSLSSRHVSLFALGIVGSVLMALAFGFAVLEPSGLPFSPDLALISILATSLVQAAERWNRHVVECEPFFKFR